ncbi:scavenger receptor cysteine-rich domain-containing protein DMBT1-like [Antedon mediterranea]|uniref:scavenger receptor cysteine-rich domain-containing protein DMBT1-like n=1 Tax=Antedon mediterranea TaxID=105859 RepID=UPI003AF87ACF
MSQLGISYVIFFMIVMLDTVKTEIRLVGGPSQNEGRVELYYNGEWGTICDDGWDMQDATVVCRQLGYVKATGAPSYAAYGPGNAASPILLDQVACSGSESNILDCGNRGLNVHSCSHKEDAGAICRNFTLRLVGGYLESEGRVEVFKDGQWGTVCHNGWDQNDAKVVCRQLDYPDALSAVTGSEFGQGVGPIHFTSVQCTGNESRLDLCGHSVLTSSCGHNNDAGAYCTPIVRLVDGLNSFEGRIEYYYYKEWGTVCDDNWDRFDADVVCRQLGFSKAIEATKGGIFGAGSGRIHLDEVECGGQETNLAACDHNVWGKHNCNHSEDAGVRCGIPVRLVGGTTALEGRVEIFYQGKWGTICDDSWGVQDATVVCNSLSYTGISEAFSRAYFGQGSGAILLDDVACVGTETGLNQCQSRNIGTHNCGHTEDAGVRCSMAVRLVGGNTALEGRVEIFYQGKWGTICDDSWGVQDATVVCNSLSYTGISKAFSGAYFGQGSGAILLDNVACVGTETGLNQCPSNGIGIHNCGHNEDAGVRCSMHDVRLVGGSGQYEGRVEIYYNGKWGTICDDNWDIHDATVVCRQLGYVDATGAPGRAAYGEGNAAILLDEVACSGSESNILDCDSNGLNVNDCRHSEDAGVVCNCKQDIRLVGGSGQYEGRVEIYYNGEWGTICDDNWDIHDATVVCRQLGYLDATGAPGRAAYGEGNAGSPILLDNVACSGSESNILDCSSNGLNVHNCGHSEDAGVICVNSQDVRLVGGSGQYEGRVEIYYNGEWGTICDDNWDIHDATVVCRQLGYLDATGAPGRAAYGEGNAGSPILLDNVACSGSERNILDCSSNGLNVHNCGHSEDAGVICVNSQDVRLVGGLGQYEGRVEIYYNGEWGTICDDNWDIHDATVVCRQLGYLDATGAPGRAAYGEGNAASPILLDNVACSGSESNILDCSSNGLNVHDCSHKEDAGVVCGNYTLRLTEGTLESEGRVEVFKDGQWGTVCDNGWDQKDAKVVCLQLEYPDALSAVTGSEFGQRVGPIHFGSVQCTGTEPQLHLCSHSVMTSSCGQQNNAGVRCMPKVRLVDGLNSFEGRIEYFYNKEWGTVCDDNWDRFDADVVCRQLGFGAAEVTNSDIFGAGSGRIHFSEVECDGQETNLAACDHSVWGKPKCNHWEDVGVKCKLPSAYNTNSFSIKMQYFTQKYYTV